MPKVSLTVQHELGEDEARNRIQHLLADVREKYGRQVSDIREEWNGNSCDLGWKSMGMGMSATIQIHPSDVSVDGNMPMAFMAFKGKMEQLVRDRVTQALAPAPV
ncbi:MAG: polyhydroxyalkanoic acid system family protein [Thermomicrobiales bacterium]